MSTLPGPVLAFARPKAAVLPDPDREVIGRLAMKLVRLRLSRPLAFEHVERVVDGLLADADEGWGPAGVPG